MLLKSSDFITHDLLPEHVFEGCTTSDDGPSQSEYELELVLRKWYPVDRGREVRCFVRDNVLLGEQITLCHLRIIALSSLIGISQRDTNYYEFWNERQTQSKIIAGVVQYWEQEIKGFWMAQQNCAFCFLLQETGPWLVVIRYI